MCKASLFRISGTAEVKPGNYLQPYGNRGHHLSFQIQLPSFSILLSQAGLDRAYHITHSLGKSNERLTSGAPSPSAGKVLQESPLSAAAFCIHFLVDLWLIGANRSHVLIFLFALLEKKR